MRWCATTVGLTDRVYVNDRPRRHSADYCLFEIAVTRGAFVFFDWRPASLASQRS